MLSETEEALTIGDMAARSGLSEHTLRYYERIGLIKPITRDHSSGHRRYSPETARMVEALACLKATGMPIEDMRTYLELWTKGNTAAAELRALFVAHKATIEQEMEKQQRRLRYLDTKAAYWEAVEAGDTDGMARIAERMLELAKQLNKRSKL